MVSNTSEGTIAHGTEPSHRDRGVLCPKCEHLNRWGTNACNRCSARLYVSCVSCGQKNERVRSQCTSCGRKLHRSMTSRLGLTKTKKLKVEPIKLIAFIVCLGIAYALIVFLGGA